MDTRGALVALAAEQGLDGPRTRALMLVAGLGDEPAAVAVWVPRVLGAVAAVLVGLGLVFWVAANWDSLPRLAQFALLQGVVVVMALAAWACPCAARAPLALLALLGIGGLFAFFGQTYQTGADAWQLFALWAALALPLAWGARSELVWAPWALVALSGVALWSRTHTAHQWRVESVDLVPQLIAWAVAVVLVAAFTRPVWRHTGAGVWSLRLATTLAAALVGGTAVMALFHTPTAAQYWLGLVVIGAGLAVFASRAAFDVYGLAVLAQTVNGLLVAGIGKWLFDGRRSSGDPLAEMMLLGLAGAGLLAWSVKLILQLARQRKAEGLA